MRKSFTIIELLIVVVVIGVLATIAIPSYTNSVERVKFAKAQHNLVLMLKAATMCMDDPYGGNGDADKCGEDAAHKYVDFTQGSDSDWSYFYQVGGMPEDATRLSGSYKGCEIFLQADQHFETQGSCVKKITAT